MATLIEMQKQLDTLKRARGSGVLSATDASGRRIEYRSMKDLEAAIGAVSSEIDRLNAATLGLAPRARVMRSFAGKGV